MDQERKSASFIPEPYRKTCLGWFLMVSGKSVIIMFIHLNGNSKFNCCLFFLTEQTLPWQQNTGSHIQFSIYGTADWLQQKVRVFTKASSQIFWFCRLLNHRCTWSAFIQSNQVKKSKKGKWQNNIFMCNEPAYINMMRNLILFL